MLSVKDVEMLAAKLQATKQELYNEAVEGNPRQPAECVDYVTYEILDWLDQTGNHSKNRPLQEVINFYPDYAPDNK